MAPLIKGEVSASNCSAIFAQLAATAIKPGSKRCRFFCKFGAVSANHRSIIDRRKTMSEGESSWELFTSESEIADHTQQESSTSSQQISLQRDQESSPADQGGAIPDQKDQNVQVQSAIPLETPDEEQSDIVLVESLLVPNKRYISRSDQK